MKSLSLLSAVFFGLPLLAHAANLQERGTWKGPSKTVEVKANSIRFNGQEYTFGKEELKKAYSAVAWDVILCKADIRQAFRTKTGEVVLLNVTRSKTSLSDGVFCRLSEDASQFKQVHEFQQIVLKEEAGNLAIKVTDVKDGKQRPDITLADLQDPQLLEKNAKLRKFIQKGDQVDGRIVSTGSVKEFELSSFQAKRQVSPTVGDEEKREEASEKFVPAMAESQGEEEIQVELK
ncbi:MAG: hypothetical protein AB7K68_08830 [Bacteriovoracia bacterium]